ncbi:acyl-CoA synthetase [Roseateles koreensis]|uniref:Acyl-CoA synthetase n=1 Tax=Roseateles koreensis TaxID=2987526 RepID=A0ABT5KPI7_9BURK|nr:acyl-CoA synthetase [Roseateles koreensis]MDC8784826.1 acyl-CoA synthetase [Roseateles koreensis]
MLIRHNADIRSLEAAQPDPFSTHTSTYALIAESAKKWPTATALSFFAHAEDFKRPQRWTYAELLADITRSANLFRRLGIQRKDVVAFVLPNLPETHFTIWGGETAGIVFAINPMIESAQMGQLLNAAHARWLVTTAPAADAETWARVGQALAAADSVQGILVVDPMRHLPGDVARPDAMAALPATLQGRPVLDFHAALQQERGDGLNFEPPKAQDTASYLCTGGTTGLPKIARHTHRNETANALQLVAVAEDLFMAPGRNVLTALPLFHVNAQIGTGLAAFAAGAHVVLAPPAGYRAPGLVANFWKIVEHYKLASFSGVPTIYAGLMQVPVAGHDLSSLTYAVCGAAPLPVELALRVQAETGLRILEAYGLTETTCAASVNPGDGQARIGSIGFSLPWQAMQVAVCNEAGHFLRWAGTDEVGAICMNGPNVMPGYLDEAHNRGTFFEAPGPDGVTRRWLNSGDLGRQDADGFFWLTGRKKELIIRGGHNIDPKTIEEALAKHPDVAMSAAVGRPDAYAGEVPVAYVQLNAGSTVSMADLMAYAAEFIGERAAQPKAIRILASLPLTAVGKIFKPTLTMMEIESVVREEAQRLGVILDTLRVAQDSRLGIVAHWKLGSGNAAEFARALGVHVFKNFPLD